MYYEKNKEIVKKFMEKWKIKNQNLMKLYNYYGIEFDGDKYHSATYDVTKPMKY